MKNSGPIVFYVEPSPACARLMGVFISGFHNCQVMHSSCASEAIDVVVQLQPSLIMTEMQLVNMTGLEFLQALRKNELTRHIPVLGVSADSFNNEIECALENGFSAYITKPFVVEELYEVITRYI